MAAVGKTTIGKKLAIRLNKEFPGMAFSFQDADSALEWIMGRTIKDVIVNDGIKTFRKEEAQYYKYYTLDHAVIATGGGCVETPANRKKIKKDGFNIYLTARNQTIIDRLKKRKHLKDQKNWKKFIAEKNNLRRPYFEKLADITVNAEDPKVIDNIIKQMKIKIKRWG